MPKYRAKTLCFVDGAKIRPGQVFSTNSPPNEAWEPVDAAPAAPAADAKAAPGKGAAKAASGSQDDESGKSGPVEDPFEKMSDEKLRDYIQTKGGQQPAPNASHAKLVSAAKAASGSQG